MATTPNLGADGGSSSFCSCKRTLRKSAGRHALSARTQAVEVQAKRSAGLQVVVFSIFQAAMRSGSFYARVDRLLELLVRRRGCFTGCRAARSCWRLARSRWQGPLWATRCSARTACERVGHSKAPSSSSLAIKAFRRQINACNSKMRHSL